MTERERLIELLANTDSYCQEPLADYLIANGVIVPPCKVGDMVYFLLEDTVPVHRWYIAEEKVTEVCSKGFFIRGYCPPRDDLGECSDG